MTSTSTNCAPNSTNSRSRRRRAAARPARNASSPASRRFSGSSRSTAARPQHGEDRDIFERLYAVRLDRLRALDECRSLLAPLDHQGLLTGRRLSSAAPSEAMDEDELLAELEGAAGSSDITELRHVRTSAEKRAAEEIANREKCEDFETIQAAVPAGSERARSGHPRRRVADSSLQSRNQARPVLHPRRPKRLCRRGGRDLFECPRAETDARLRVIY